MGKAWRVGTALRVAGVSLFLVLALGGGLATLGPSPAAPSSSDRFTVIQLNDVYKVEGLEHTRWGGLARVRTLRKDLESRMDLQGRTTPVLVLHAGDLLFPSVMSKYLKAQPMIRCLNALDGEPDAFDPGLVLTFGNHEFEDKDPMVILGRVAQSDFRWVSSNTYFRSNKTSKGEPFSRRLRNVFDTLVLDVGPTKVGLLAITTDNQPRDYVRYDYEQPARDAAVKAALAALDRDGARVKIAITHQDMSDDVQLAKTFPEIDLIVGGHDHLFQEKRVGHAAIAKSDADARSVVVTEVRVPGQGPVETAPRRVFLGPDVLPDPVVKHEVDASLDALAKVVKERTGRELDKVVATTENALEGVEPAIRGRETALGNFLTDVVREKLGTDVAFLNGGAIRINDDIPAGSPLTVYDLEGIFFFDNDLVAGELTGAELLEVLRTSVAKVDAAHGAFLQVAGLKFTYRVTGKPEARAFTVDPKDVLVGGKPLDLTRKYTAGTLDYVWENGYRDGYALFARGKGGDGKSPPRLPTPKADWRKTTEAAIEKLPGNKITAAIEGRIVRVESK